MSLFALDHVLARQAAAQTQTITANTPWETTSSLQQFGLFIVCFFPTLAFVVVCMRLYIRWKQAMIAIRQDFWRELEKWIDWWHVRHR